MSKSEFTFKQSQRVITAEEVKMIQQTFKRFPALSLSELAGTVCEHLNWLTASGLPKETACKQLFNQMEAQGLIRLPTRRSVGGVSKPPPKKTSRTEPQPLFEVPLKEIAPIEITPVADLADKNLWNEYIERHHPLGYKKPTGFSLRYFIRAREHYLGCILLSGAALALAPRDGWIGWSAEQRRANLSWIVNNSRYLIFPWVKVPHLASHVLGQLARRVADDWEELWGFRPLLLETFVDPAFFSGVCYKAAGWELLGETTGRGLIKPGKSYKTSPKLIYVKPLSPHYQSLLCSKLQGRTEL
jgi:hypothetical protein